MSGSLGVGRDLCECGHLREQHFMLLVPGNQAPGACSASVDLRHPSTGGGGLKPCSCRGYKEAS